MRTNLGTFREILIFVADNISQQLTGIPIDLRKDNLLFTVLGYIPDAVAPTRFDIDKSNGHWLPKPGGEYSQQELDELDRLNHSIDETRQFSWDATDRAVRDLLPAGVDFFPTDPIPIERGCNTWWESAAKKPKRDPLAIDLNSNGIETIGATAHSPPILFDYDGDGIKTGTGWLRPDDAWLVRDLNGNGTIDNGLELFGVDTNISAPGTTSATGSSIRKASSGFEALRALDSNADGVFNSSDAAWNEVKLWQDLNSDGVSQAGEISTLVSKSIIGISLNATTTNTDLENGNVVTGTATVLRSSGSILTAGSVDLTASNLDLASNPFYRQFPDVIAPVPAALALPNMGGSGWVRDLREAMSLGSAAASALQLKVATMSQANTRAGQLAALDALLEGWGASSGRYAAGGAVGLEYSVTSETPTAITGRYVGSMVLATTAAFGFQKGKYSDTVGNSDGTTRQVTNGAGREVLRRMGVLEVFNGARFIDFSITTSKQNVGSSSGSAGGSGSGTTSGSASPLFTLTITDGQATSINAAYDALRDSVYQSIALQTRLRSYLDAVQLVIDATGVRFDASPLQALLEATRAAKADVAFEDLSDLVRYATPTLTAIGFDGIQTLRTWAEGLPAGSALLNEFADLHLTVGAALSATASADVFLGDATANSVNGGAGGDILDGGGGNDSLYGGEDDDIARGGSGGDNLYGEAGNDTLDGGLGNDYLTGGTGSDTYLFGKGDGQDYLYSTNDPTAGKVDTLQFKAGVLPGDVSFSASAGTLTVRINGTTDQFTVQDFLYQDNIANAWNSLQQIRFADGTTWTAATIVMKLPGAALVGSTGSNAVSMNLIAKPEPPSRSWATSSASAQLDASTAPSLDVQVQALTAAIAAFSPPGMTSWTAEIHDHAARTPVMAASWY